MISQRSPLGVNSILTSPRRSDASARSSSSRPKPLRDGGVTAGPPDSVQWIANWRSGRTSQDTSTTPLLVDSAPYLAALVVSSWIAMPSTSAHLGLSVRFGPDTLMLPALR